MNTFISKLRLTRIIVLSCTFATVFFPTQFFGWGQNGHRAIGLIAENHLSAIAKANIERLFNGESMAEASTWMDEIKSDSLYDHMYDWHWVSIPDSSNYESSEKNHNGDIIETIERLIKELQTRTDLSLVQERSYVRMLIHLVGDIHQPLHVGNGKDRGGNDVKVTWFWDEETNLHRVWDSDMIDKKQLCYTELAAFCDNSSFKDRQRWQNQGVRVWARESQALRGQVYEIPEDKMLSYEYMYKNWDTVKLRLVQAGVRLAEVLNTIYG